MATTKEYHDYVIECLNKAGEVTSRKMMGEYCLYYNGKLFGDICDNRLLVKQTETSKRLLADIARLCLLVDRRYIIRSYMYTVYIVSFYKLLSFTGTIYSILDFHRIV